MPASKAHPCSELARTITALALNIGADPKVKGIDGVVAEMQKDIPEITRAEVVNSIVEATQGHARTLDEVGQKLDSLKREARSDKATRQKIAELQRHLEAGTVPSKQPRADRTAEAVKLLKSIKADFEKQVSKSDPAQRKKIMEQIESLAERLESVKGAPPEARASQPMSKELERLVYRRDTLRRQIRQKINDLRPKGFWGVAGDVANIPRTLMTSFDFSAVLRQAGFSTLGHPVRAVRNLGPMFRSFASKEAAYRIDAEIRDRPNAPLYDRSKLYLAPLDGSLAKSEEAFMSRLAAKVPGVGGSQRAYVTFLNKMRADTFDAMAAALDHGAGLTLEEASAISNFVNVATGRGSFKNSNTAATLSTVFFSPRLMASRFQLLAAPLTGFRFGGGSVRTRAAIAKEYARFLTGAAVVYTLADLAGADFEWDPRSSDFGKIRFGDTRLDPLAGLAQVTTLTGRMATGETKQQSGKIAPLTAPDAKYGQRKRTDVLWDFMRSKFAPTVGAAMDVADGENVVGERVTPGSAALSLITPLSAKEIAEVMEEHGVAKGTALGILNLFGMGLQHHEQKK